MQQRKQVWNHRYDETNGSQKQAALVLLENQHLLPTSGDALDLACGLGANALFLAERGLHTFAWDISEVAISKLRAVAEQRNLTVDAQVRDLLVDGLERDSFDVITVSNFLERSMVCQIVAALKENGLLFYQTFSVEKVAEAGPKNPDYLLAANELLRLFADMHVLVYREEGCVGEVSQGLRNQAIMVAQRRAKRVTK